MIRSTRPLLVLAVVLVATPPSSARAQIPDRFENLQVLPRDISRDQLTDIMRVRRYLDATRGW